MATNVLHVDAIAIPPPWTALASAGITVPATPEHVDLLCSDLLRRKRDYPIVVLTAREHRRMPSISVLAVREIVGPNVPVYFVTRAHELYFTQSLAPMTPVTNGSLRVYWPGVRGDPWGHPLFYDRTGKYGRNILERLAQVFTPGIASEPQLAPEERILVLERELARVRKWSALELRTVRARYEAMLLSEPSGEHESKRRGRSLPRRAGRQRPDLEDEMRRLIHGQWAAYIPERFRPRNPLHDYSMSPQFFEDLGRRVGNVPIDRTAWVCALVACQFPLASAGLASGPLRPAPEAPQLTREGGAQAWWCELRRKANPGQGPRVVYWTDADGAPEFVALGFPNDAATGL